MTKDVEAAELVLGKGPAAEVPTPLGSSAPDAHERKSSWWAAAGHIITCLLGPGILAMPYIMAMLGWIGGSAALVIFFLLTRWTSGMMAQVYQVDGRRHGRYDVAVRSILGNRHAAFLAISQHVNLVLANVGFQIAAADSISYIAKAVCLVQGTPAGQCWDNQPILTVIVGVVQLLMSQMRNLQAASWSSAVGAAASVIYCIIVLGLAAAQAGNRQGTIHGTDEPINVKVFSAFNALGAVGFALNAPIITFEVADTLREPPAAAVSMQKSLTLSLGACLALFASGGVLGYLALGDAVGENFLLAFQDTAPTWVLITGSLMVVLNMVPAYQVCGQPTFAAVEDGFFRKLGSRYSCISSKSWLLPLVFRSCYVAFTTLVAAALPFFTSILGLVGALTFFQTGILYPMLLHSAVYKPSRRMAGLMGGVLALAAAVTLMAVIGSVAVIAMNASMLSPLKA